jgi:hypothetical protein
VVSRLLHYTLHKICGGVSSKRYIVCEYYPVVWQDMVRIRKGGGPWLRAQKRCMTNMFLSKVRWYSWYVLAPVDRGGATSTPRNSCSFGRKIIIKTGICSLRLGKYKNTCFLEILDYCGGITGRATTPAKNRDQNIPAVPSCPFGDDWIALQF